MLKDAEMGLMDSFERVGWLAIDVVFVFGSWARLWSRAKALRLINASPPGRAVGPAGTE